MNARRERRHALRFSNLKIGTVSYGLSRSPNIGKCDMMSEFAAMA